RRRAVLGLRPQLPRLRLGGRPRPGVRRALRRAAGLAHVAARPRRRPLREVPVIRHLLRLVWNRKRANALLMLEIFFSFLVVFVVSTAVAFAVSSYRRPLGFAWQDVWWVQADDQGAHAAMPRPGEP